MKINFRKQFVTSVLSILLLIVLVQCTGKDQNGLLLKKSVALINIKCPIAIDKTTTLDSCIVQPNNTLRYVYTIDSEKIGDSDMPFIKIMQAHHLIQELQSDKVATNPLMTANVTFEYFYYYKRGGYAYDISLDPQQYKETINWKNDDYVHNRIEEVVLALQAQYPMEYDNVKETDIYSTYPRTVNFVIEQTDFIPPIPFDTIKYKKEDMAFMKAVVQESALTELLPHADIIFRYIYYGKNGKYLFTLEFEPKDYQN